jgi:hypothetical protein
MGGEKGRVSYPKRVEDRAVWQDSVAMCPVCEKLCIIAYKWGEAIEAFNCGAYTFPGRVSPHLQPGEAFFYRGVHVGTVVGKDGVGLTVSRRGQDNEASDPLDGQDFTFERHHCPGRQLNEQGWAVWYNGFYHEGPLYVVREEDTAPSAHPGDHIWMKICPLCLRAYLNKLSMDAKHEGLYLAPKTVIAFNTMHPAGKQLVEAIVETKSDIIPDWKRYP